MTFRLATLVAALFVCAATLGCAKETTPGGADIAGHAKVTGLPDRDPALAKKLVEKGALLLDVRSQGEFDAKHLEGAVLIPVQTLERRMSEVDAAVSGNKDKPIVVYCRSGARSSRAKNMLLEAGYTQVTNLGGMSAWPSR